MHFWIDKRSQGCGYNGRYPRRNLIPPSFSGSSRAKLMVTPVHRFQSIDSVTPGGIRHPRRQTFGRFSVNCHLPLQYNDSSNSSRSLAADHSRGILSGVSNTPRRTRNNSMSKFKCGVWIAFGVFTFLLAGAKYYFDGATMTMEAFAFCLLIAVIVIVGGLVSLYEALTPISQQVVGNVRTQVVSEQPEVCEIETTQIQTSMSQTSVELPPPPYHVAIMLPPQREQPTEEIVQDSPPPPYDKATS